jgi:hypothetical protein
MRIGIAIAVVALSGVMFTTAVAQQAETKKDKPAMAVEKAKDTLVCPMHPGVKPDKDEKCPKCGMTMEKKHGSPAVKHASKPEACKAHEGKSAEECKKHCEGKAAKECKKHCDGKSCKDCKKQCEGKPGKDCKMQCEGKSDKDCKKQCEAKSAKEDCSKDCTKEGEAGCGGKH